MSTSRIQNTNLALKDLDGLLRLLDLIKANSLERDMDWSCGMIVFPNPVVSFSRQNSFGVFDEKFQVLTLSPSGRSALVRLYVDFDRLIGRTHDRYAFKSILGVGSESIVYLAEHASLGTKFAIKVFTNLAAEEAFDSLTKTLKNQGVPQSSAVIFPIDEFRMPVPLRCGGDLELKSVVFPLVRGSTLRNFCEKSSPLSPYFVSDLVHQLTRSLAELEKMGICHGDLHLDNILVDENSDGSVSFKIVDISGNHALGKVEVGDYASFKGIVVHVLSMLPLRNMSLQKHLGPRLYCIVQDLLSGETESFSDFVSRIESDVVFLEYERKKLAFLKKNFKEGEALGLFKHEEMVDPTVARDMFIPYKSFFSDFSLFGNAILYGNRGSGKSSYMASLAFYPLAHSAIVQPEQYFGILFACRQGEFRQYFSVPQDKLEADPSEIGHLLVTKIIRKTLKVFCDLLVANPQTKFTVRSLLSFLEKAYPSTFFQTEGLSRREAVDSIYQTIVRHEAELQLGILNQLSVPDFIRLGTEDLIEFFGSVKQAFEKFSASRFFILFDDAGIPNVPHPIQRAINDLLISRNSVFCVKVSSERNSYDDRDSTGTTVEVSHDVALFNLSEIYTVPSGISPNRGELREYFRSLVNLRLQDYQSSDILNYLGETPIKSTDLVSRLAIDVPKNAVYAGWEVIWQLANSNPRILLELISCIFTHSGVTSKSPSGRISLEKQNESIVSFSENRLRALRYLPGRVKVHGQYVATGQQIFNIATTFGKISRQKLRDDARFKIKKPKRKRFSEMLAIEVDKGTDLPPDANDILRQMVRFGVFDDCRFVTAWDDQRKKFLLVFNRIYTPALGMSFRRDIHWRISAGRLSAFLLKPTSVQTYKSARTDTPDQADLL